MTRPIDDTHEPSRRSWVEAANRDGADFPVQNLPFGVFRRRATEDAPRIGVAIGDQILDLVRCRDLSLLEGLPGALLEATARPSLNALVALGASPLSQLRRRISELLSADRGKPDLRVLVPMKETETQLPLQIGDYTDFYASIFHARSVGRLFRPGNPLLPNYRHLPIGYHGRSSSIVVSGTPVGRPCGQTDPDRTAHPSFGPTRSLDYEVELGVFVGRGNELGRPVRLDDAEARIFGVCLLNDWSARDLQAWEAQPLGPFLAKSFATSVSPWVVTLEALAPFRCPAFVRSEGDPRPLPNLFSERNEAAGGLGVTVDVLLRSERCAASGSRRCS